MKHNTRRPRRDPLHEEVENMFRVLSPGGARGPVVLDKNTRQVRCPQCSRVFEQDSADGARCPDCGYNHNWR